MALLGLRCWAWALSSVASGGFSCCGARALGTLAQ